MQQNSVKFAPQEV